MYGIAITTYNVSAAAAANPNPSSGQIAFINVTAPGSGYSVVPEVEIFNESLATPTDSERCCWNCSCYRWQNKCNNCDKCRFRILYCTNNQNLVVSSVMRAMAKCTVATDGRITGVDLTFTGGWPGYPLTAGYGYDAAPTVTFFPSVPGLGSGAVGIATITNGRVSSVRMTNEGSAI